MSSGREKLGKVLVERQPWLLKNGDRLYRPLRRFKPVLRIKKAVILTRHADVRQVLERDDVFSVTYGEHMEAVTGPFILGWDDGPQYQREVTALRAAVRRDDLPLVADLSRERARELFTGSEVDAVTLADEAVGACVDRYFGLPELAGPDMRDAARRVFRAVFLDAETPETVQRGQESSHRMVAAIDAALARERAAPTDTVLGRLVAAGDLDDDGIHRNLVGLVAAWAASVPRAFSLALDALLDRETELTQVARHTDEHTISRLWLEALRIQPQAPFLMRVARTEMVIAPGSPREERIEPGDIVVASTHSGMHDRTVLDGPERLIPDRPIDDYLHFGAGIHRCFGAGISQAQFGAVGAVLLGSGPIERGGPLTWSDAFPAHLPVRRSGF
jgi:cytochrome P450